jgi:choline dehydrogenase-like flavoprotein
MSHSQSFDVIIIGTGAGGGTLARHLASSGKRILLLERGDYVPREKENWDSRASFFPASGAVNPGLTIMANALRVGDHLLARMM